MAQGEEKAKQWQFSLRTILIVFGLFGLEIVLLKHGPLFYFFGPLLLAAVLQVAGYPRAATRAAIFTIFFWFCFPCIYGTLEMITG